MKISKKCQYALRAVFELVWHNNGRPLKTSEIAKAQQISPGFLEIILNELKHGGFVESKRGNEGGYMLAREIDDITVLEIMEYIQGPISVAPDTTIGNKNKNYLGNEAFRELWSEVNNAVCEVCKNKTFASLIELERVKRDKYALNYSI